MNTIATLRNDPLAAALASLAALRLALLLSLLVVLLLAAQRVEAAECRGEDMAAELQRSDPDLLQAIRAEAAKTPNGQGLLWKIEGSGAAPSFLFGTMHMADPRVVELSPAADAAFQDARTLIIESTEILDKSAMAAALMAEPELTMFTDGSTLRSLIDPEDLPEVERRLAERGVPLSTVNRMKPWMISAMIALPACELQRTGAGEPVLDLKLALDAQAAGKQVEGLETVREQLGAMASLPLDFHIEGLVETLRLGDRIDDVMETMVALYLAGETGMFWPFFRAVLPGDGEEASYADFEQVMVTARNSTMAERAVPFIEQGGAFIAVGALHLPGEEGIVSLLRKRGYSLSRID